MLTIFFASASNAASLEVEPGISLYYRDEGKGTPILFVPGRHMMFGEDSEAFNKILSDFLTYPNTEERSK